MATSGTSSVTDFYPRSPCGERLRQPGKIQGSGHFYPRSPCGERPVHFMRSWTTTTFLSTLSLRRATSPNGGQYSVYSISIHALLAESDCAPRITPTASRNFYPRSPCGERLRFPLRLFSGLVHFYPRSPCGERRDVIAVITEAQSISIHALLAESDNSSYGALDGASISIHALLAESDSTQR